MPDPRFAPSNLPAGLPPPFAPAPPKGLSLIMKVGVVLAARKAAGEGTPQRQTIDESAAEIESALPE